MTISPRPPRSAVARAAVLIVPLALLTAAPAARAQLAHGVELGGQTVRLDGRDDVGGLTLASVVRLERPRASVLAAGALWDGGDGARLRDAAARLALRPPPRGPLSAELAARVGRGAPLGLRPRSDADVDARLFLARRSFGVWADGSVAHASARALLTDAADSAAADSAPVSDRVGARRAATAGVGVWKRLGEVTLTASAEWSAVRGRERREVTRWVVMTDSSIADTLPRLVPTVRWQLIPAVRSHADLRAGVHWRHGRVELAALGGRRLGWTGARVGGSAWGSLTGAVLLARDVAVVAALAREPADVLRGLPAQRMASLGLRFSPSAWTARALPVAPAPASAPHFELRPAGVGRHTVRVHAPGARSVELMGDFTGWRPVALRDTGHGWETTLPIPRGVRQLNIRVDGGEWRPPPGVNAMSDGFGGVVGVIVVE